MSESNIKIDQLIRCRRRSIGLKIDNQAQLIVRAPRWVSLDQINKLLLEKQRWIESKQRFVRDQIALPPISDAVIKECKRLAHGHISARVEHFAKISGLTYKSVSISNAKTRWGSCSYSGNLRFSWVLMMAPQRVLDYLVVHELMHLKQRNHSYKFWAEVEQMIPDYKTDELWLKNNGYLLRTT